MCVSEKVIEREKKRERKIEIERRSRDGQQKDREIARQTHIRDRARERESKIERVRVSER